VPKRFQFRLQPLIEQKEIQIRLARQLLAIRQNERDEAETLLQKVTAMIEKARDELKSAEDYLRDVRTQALTSERDWSGTIAQAESMLVQPEIDLAEADRIFTLAQKRRNNTITAAQEANAAYLKLCSFKDQIENLRQKELIEFRKEQELKEMAEISEVGAAMHYINNFVENEEGEPSNG
jgi:hypothetical protein